MIKPHCQALHSSGKQALFKEGRLTLPLTTTTATLSQSSARGCGATFRCPLESVVLFDAVGFVQTSA